MIVREKHDPKKHAAELAPLLESDERKEIWGTEREMWRPEVLIKRDATGKIVGALLHTGRAMSSQRVVVDVLAETPEIFKELLTELTAESDALVIHLSEHPAFNDFDKDLLEELGFTKVEQPLPSVASTILENPTGVKVWSRWKNSKPSRITPYYGQTTEVSCGAVTALSALHNLGDAGFSSDLDTNRSREIAFWRKATNLPGCEPIGLAVETLLSGRAHELIETPPKVIMSKEGPVLLDEFKHDPAEMMLREDLQQESLKQALDLGIPIEYRWIDTAEIFALVAAGRQVFLLIDLNDLIADPTLHWVLAYDVVDEHLIISDPWVQYPNGETWADTYALPLPEATIDHITKVEEDVFRAVIVL